MIIDMRVYRRLNQTRNRYRILCISDRGYYFFVRQKTLYNWVSAALISGAATIRFKEMNIYAMEIFPNRVFALL